MTGAAAFVFWPVAGIALWAAVVDFLWLRIPNAVHLALLAVFAVFVLPGLAVGDVAARLGVAVVLFGIGFALYAVNVLGAGDVKYLAAAAPLLPAEPAVLTGWLLLVTTAGLPVLGLHRMARFVPATARFPSFAEAGYFPYGPAISIGLVTMLWMTGGIG